MGTISSAASGSDVGNADLFGAQAFVSFSEHTCGLLTLFSSNPFL